MRRLVRSLLTVVCALSACAFTAAPTLGAKHHGAGAAQTGIVLSAAHGIVRLVDGHHRVTGVRVASTRSLRRGAVVAIRNGRAHVTGRVRKVSFYGRVVRTSARGAVLRLADGSTFKVASGRRGHGAHAASTLTIDLQGLAPGQAVLITISSDDRGNVVLTIKLVSAGTSIGDGEQTATGYVTDDSSEDSFAIRASDGSGLRFADPQQLLAAADAQLCDTVVVTYHAEGRRLVADTLRDTGQSDQGSCAAAQQGTQSDGGEVDGIVTAIAGDGTSLTVDPGDGSGPSTVPVPDPTLLDGVSVGDEVAVVLDDGGNATEIDVLDSSPGQQGGDGGEGTGDSGDG